ncbi:hypothetical protein SARC_13338 [Sphaeroforma arctica JP610]|uniref:Uncharacterized protein n=1 Tax=Sphaeroforma arctica JP610 TaxID=667725 RepID=A0A0L0FBI7_9EUKA|nr:hypothetical protein SARC_13338 [Sphaeroforma arctica JP610]KNC74105.1 hypothetical protein SARC_13338 [Sphaeroforma arctica JP610]|eukprot:XP_014148007.1 hypothetical protein SARC_13338 [Sphaeroforma arctica JP610]
MIWKCFRICLRKIGSGLRGKTSCSWQPVVKLGHFGFMFMQPEPKGDELTATVGGNEVIFQTLYADKANSTLINHKSNAKLKTLLFALSDADEHTIIGIDSCKVHRGSLTPPHFDLYSTTLKRVQAMDIGPAEGDVRLCFLRGSHTAREA